MTDMTAKNKILVLGRPKVNKEQIINSVVSQTPLDYNVEAKDSDDGARITWSLDTRYYQAQLEFWVDNTETLPPSQIKHMEEWLANPDLHSEEESCSIPEDPSMAQLQEHLSEVVDAIIFAFDPTDPSSFSDILPWARFAKLHAPGVLLCVAVTADGKPVEASKDEWFEWCVANGWEWLDLTDADPDTEYTVGRLREALESNEWANMEPIRKPLNCEKPPATTAEEAPSIAFQDTAAEPHEPATKSEWDGFEGVAQTLDPARIDAMHRALFSGDREDDDMAAVLDRIRSARNEISQMDQDKARTRAAELAMAVAKMLT
ncbi:hypothetical protein H4218_001532 [Coemansia sp. IMI 209128]|nr:hypothetical protein H4218_001532 [Coemansia sp. IMI 209128]